MAYADATTNGRIILQGSNPMDIVLSEAVECGDLLGSSANTWKRADAAGASSVNVYPELIASKKAASGDTIIAYRQAVVGGVSGGTKGKPLYLADAAGETLETKGTETFIVGFVLTATTIFLCPQDLDSVVASKLNRSGVVVVSVDKTLTLADCGIVQIVDTDAKIITLPATTAGANWVIMNGGADATVLVAVSPAAADKIQGMGVTAADNKDFNNTKATAKFGDFLHVVGDGTDGWLVVEERGIWAKEA